MGRNPDYFPNPLKFDPLRFDSEETIKLFSFIPFSAGPRYDFIFIYQKFYI